MRWQRMHEVATICTICTSSVVHSIQDADGGSKHNHAHLQRSCCCCRRESAQAARQSEVGGSLIARGWVRSHQLRCSVVRCLAWGCACCGGQGPAHQTRCGPSWSMAWRGCGTLCCPQWWWFNVLRSTRRILYIHQHGTRRTVGARVVAGGDERSHRGLSTRMMGGQTEDVRKLPRLQAW